jgi:hypothetical protein
MRLAEATLGQQHGGDGYGDCDDHGFVGQLDTYGRDYPDREAPTPANRVFADIRLNSVIGCITPKDILAGNQ